MNIDNITNINNTIINKKVIHVSFNPAFFILSNAKPSEKFPKHSGYGFIAGVLLGIDKTFWH